jgi:F-type H+-transporting ATPase subunit b
MVFCVAVDGIDSLFSVFENNLVNWLVLVGLLIWLCSKYVPPLLQARKEKIEAALSEAAKTKTASIAFLEAQQKRLSAAEEEAKNILTEARQIAANMNADIVAQTKKDMAALEQNMKLQLENERRLAVRQLRSVAARAAIKLSSQQLSDAVTDSMKSRLLREFLEEIEVSKN